MTDRQAGDGRDSTLTGGPFELFVGGGAPGKEKRKRKKKKSKKRY